MGIKMRLLLLHKLSCILSYILKFQVIVFKHAFSVNIIYNSGKISIAKLDS